MTRLYWLLVICLGVTACPSGARAETAFWHRLFSGGYYPVPADYDGDGKADVAVYEPSSGYYIVRCSGGNSARCPGGILQTPIGGGGYYYPATADYDGDGKADIAVYEPTGGYYIVRCSGGNSARCPGGVLQTQMGGGGSYYSVPADYDGDGRADFAVYDQLGGNFIVRCSGGNSARCPGGILQTQMGGNGYLPAPADYDGDGRADFAVYEPYYGSFIVRCSGGNSARCPGGILQTQMGGGNNYFPAPADFDGDHKADLTVYEPVSGTLIARLSAGASSRYPNGILLTQIGGGAQALASVGCDGVPGSGRTIDVCGVCGGDGSSCAPGCDGVAGSGKKNDACGVCGGNGRTCAGCDGVPNSGRRVDACGICGGNGQSCVGCDGVPYSGKTLDACGVCGGNGTECAGCDGVPRSGKTVDSCGICGGNDSERGGCDNRCYSNATYDACGVCGGDGSECAYSVARKGLPSMLTAPPVLQSRKP